MEKTTLFSGGVIVEWKKQLAFRHIVALILSLLLSTGLTAMPYGAFFKANTESVTLSGTINIIWGDAIDVPSTTEFYLTDGYGGLTRLLLNQELLYSSGEIFSLNGQTVMLKGEWINGSNNEGKNPIFNVQSISSETRNNLLHQTNTPKHLIGTKSFVFILCKSADELGEPKPLSFFKDMYLNTYPGLDHYWRELSYNNINLTGSDAFGWYTMPQPKSYYIYDQNGDGNIEPDFSRITEDCTSAADADIYFPNYYGINLMFNIPHSSAYGTSGWVLNRDNVTRNYGITWIFPWVYGFGLCVIEHEIGHTFGLPHTYANLADVNVWDVMGGCSSLNINDPVYGYLGNHTIAYHKDTLGWIPIEQTYITEGVGEFTVILEQLAIPQTTNYKLIKVPIGGSSTHFYTVEARKRVGYDQGIPGNAVIIHEVDSTREAPAMIVDLDEDASTHEEQMWTPGETFISITNGITLTVNTETDTGFMVTLDIGPTPPQFTTCDLQPAIPKSECVGLVALYNSTNGEDWLNNQGWLEYLDPCDWQGVGCNLNHVKWIDIANNRLSGYIPAEIGNLFYLEKVDLRNNQLSGNIPPELGNLANAKYLYLNDNHLSGSIPLNLANLDNVIYLDLSGNLLGGVIPNEFAGLSKLVYLNLRNNQLSGTIPLEFGGVSNIRTLDLRGNQLSGGLPLELFNKQFTDVFLGENQLSGGIPAEIGNWTYIQNLDLGSNLLSGSIPAELWTLTDLYSLDIGNNALEGEISPSIVNLTHLGDYELTVDFGHNKFYASNPSVISFLNEKDPDWAETQTLSPTDLQGSVQSSVSVELTWQPIPYIDDGGYYEIHVATTSSGPYILHGITSDKTNSSYLADGLTPEVPYYFVLRTYTPVHTNQKNELWSEFTGEFVITIPANAPTPTLKPTPTSTLTPTSTPVPSQGEYIFIPIIVKP